MKIHFWGVRGSIPSPITPSRVKSKISAIMERITLKDIENEESRERFLASLPPWLFGTVGGNSPCISVVLDNPDECIVFDCGSGMRELGACLDAEKQKPSHYHLFISHLHWDHLQGFPFFGPAYDPSIKIDFYSPVQNIEKALSGQMSFPYFPVSFKNTGSKKSYHHLEKPVKIGKSTIGFIKMNHPGGSYSYSVTENGKRFIYATDTELTSEDFKNTKENSAFFSGSDLLVIDCQYTLDEAVDKYNWGHNAFNIACDFAVHWGVKRMVMFHHDPLYDDHKLYSILQSAKQYLKKKNCKNLEVTLAYEGLEISI
jgi:phosphoribosyl 1,2-cyclic phosphodiesterase